MTRCGHATFDLIEGNEDAAGAAAEPNGDSGGDSGGSGGTSAGSGGTSAGSGGTSAGSGGTSAGSGGSGGTSGGTLGGAGFGAGGRETSGAGRMEFPNDCSADPQPLARCTPETCERCDYSQCSCDGDGWCSSCTATGCPKSQVCNPLSRRCADRCDTMDPDACQGSGRRGFCTLPPFAPDESTAGFCVECLGHGTCERDLFCYRDQCVECRQDCDCWFRFGARSTICSAGKCVCHTNQDCLVDSQGKPSVCKDGQCILQQ